MQQAQPRDITEAGGVEAYRTGEPSGVGGEPVDVVEARRGIDRGAAALSPSPAVLAGILGVFGASNSSIDVAMNTQGAHVEHGYAGPILSSLHAMFSVGALLAAGAAVLLAAAGVPVLVQFTAVAALAAIAGLAAIVGMTDETSSRRSALALTLPKRALLLPGRSTGRATTKGGRRPQRSTARHLPPDGA